MHVEESEFVTFPFFYMLNYIEGCDKMNTGTREKRIYLERSWRFNSKWIWVSIVIGTARKFGQKRERSRVSRREESCVQDVIRLNALFQIYTHSEYGESAVTLASGRNVDWSSGWAAQL